MRPFNHHQRSKNGNTLISAMRWSQQAYQGWWRHSCIDATTLRFAAPRQAQPSPRYPSSQSSTSSLLPYLFSVLARVAPVVFFGHYSKRIRGESMYTWISRVVERSHVTLRLWTMPHVALLRHSGNRVVILATKAFSIPHVSLSFSVLS